MDKINFEKLPDGTCVITVQGVNDVGQPYLRQEIIKQVAVFDALRSAMCEANSNAVLADVLAEIEIAGDGESSIFLIIKRDDIKEILGKYFI
ncbi:MAG: hypothetical protein HQL29_05125 [Candidatus Omnitrophica bacterium]|nr:hypothetical protein [Candidatus Omnitrophota bacterium]